MNDLNFGGADSILSILADKFIQGSSSELPVESPHDFVEALGVRLWRGIPGFKGPDRLSEILDALTLPGRPFTVVESGHGPGKSYLTAAIAAWWLEKHKPEAVVVTLAPTFQQVNNILWRYIRKFHKGGKLTPTIFETPRWDIAPSCYAVGLSPRRATQEDLQALHGYHSPNLLVVMDEAPALPRLMWEAIRGLVTGENSRILALGNPLEQAGPFWEACNSPVWNHIRINDLEHPNVVLGEEVIAGAVSRGWIDGMVRDHCRKAAGGDSGAIEWPLESGQYWQPGPVFQSRVLGLAPAEATDQLIPLSWVTGAQTWTAEPEDNEPVYLGLDPSRVSHGDAAAMVARKGGLVLWVRRRNPVTNDPTGELTGWLRHEYYRLNAARCFIEETGIGAGVVDKARSVGLPVVAVSPGGGASRRNMANKRAECWWRLREQLQGGALSLPQDDLLTGDLTIVKYHFDGQGRILLEPKDTIRERLGRSPDSGDALALTFALQSQARVAGETDISDGLTNSSRWGNQTRVAEVDKKNTGRETGKWFVGKMRRW